MLLELNHFLARNMGCAKERKVSLERCKVAYIESAEDETKMSTAPKKKAVIPNEIEGQAKIAAQRGNKVVGIRG